MASPMTITIKNLPQIKAAFGKAPRLMVRELNKAIESSLVKIEHTSRINTPVKTGTLARSHYTRYGFLKGEVGTNTNYDVFVHNGTRYMKARPYLLLSIQSNQSTVERFFTQAVDNVLSAIGRSV